jgi:hypothetical protein
MPQIEYYNIMQCHVRNLGHLEITIHDLQTYSEQKKIRKLVTNKKNNQKTIKSHKIKFYFKIKKQEKKLGALPYLCRHV